MSLQDKAPETPEAGMVLPAPETPASWRAAQAIPLRLSIAIPVSGVKLRDLRELSPGKILCTNISAADDVPVRVGGAMLGWGELDNVDGQMSVRLTRLV